MSEFNKCVLNVHPTSGMSESPILDDLTSKLIYAFKRTKLSGIVNDDGSFMPAVFRTHDTCTCGKTLQTCCDWLIDDFNCGLRTSSIHHIIWHRDAFSEADIELIRGLPSPTESIDMDSFKNI